MAPNHHHHCCKGTIQTIVGTPRFASLTERIQLLCTKKITPRISTSLKSMAPNPPLEASTRSDGQCYLYQPGFNAAAAVRPSAPSTPHPWPGFDPSSHRLFFPKKKKMKHPLLSGLPNRGLRGAIAPSCASPAHSASRMRPLTPVPHSPCRSPTI